jgi:hypothetical protein
MSSGWTVAVSSAGILNTRAVLMRGMERLLSLPGTRAGTDPALLVFLYVTSQMKVQKVSFATRHVFKELHNELNGYYGIYIAKTNREQVNNATEMNT